MKTNDNNTRELRKKFAVTIIAALLLALIYSMIFSFSAQDGEQSGGLSHMISEKCVELLNSLSGKQWTISFINNLTDYFEHPIRKIAHFGEYTCMGVLVYVMFRPWMRKSVRLYGLVILWVFLSAAADEFHQLFVPGRCGSFADVCLDTGGGAFGTLFCVFCERIFGKRKRKGV